MLERFDSLEPTLSLAPARALVRGASGTLIVAVVALGAMTYRAVSEGTDELAASDVAFNRGDLREAVLHARRSATAYAPGAPHTRSARERLRAIAVGSEARGDAEIARLAWGALRAAALETRHVRVPYASELREANERLERLAVPPGKLADGQREPAELALRRALDRVPGPSAWASGLLAAGFVLALGGLGLVGVRGLTRDGRLVPRTLAFGATAFVVGALLWAIAVYRA